MKKIIFLLVIGLALMAVSSCGTSTSLGVNLNNMDTNVVLSQNNFTVVKNVSGEATAVYVLGIGGYKCAEARSAAMSDMVEKAGLSGSQAIVNATTSLHTQTILGIYTKVTAYATGTVVEFR